MFRAESATTRGANDLVGLNSGAWYQSNKDITCYIHGIRAHLAFLLLFRCSPGFSVPTRNLVWLINEQTNIINFYNHQNYCSSLEVYDF